MTPAVHLHIHGIQGNFADNIRQGRGIKRATLALAMTLLCTAAMAAPAAVRYYPSMTGDQLVRYYFLGPPANRDEKPPAYRYVDREQARGYMDALMDLSEGTTWCHVGTKAHEIHTDIAHAISRMTPEEQKRTAAPMVLKILEKHSPCGPRRGKP